MSKVVDLDKERLERFLTEETADVMVVVLLRGRDWKVEQFVEEEVVSTTLDHYILAREALNRTIRRKRREHGRSR